MRMLMLGAASLALAASASYADPGHGKGGGNGGGHGGGSGHSAPSNPGPNGGSSGGNGGGKSHGGGGGNDHAERGNSARPSAPQMHRVSQDKGGHGNADKGNATRPLERKGEPRMVVRPVRGNGNPHGNDDVRGNGKRHLDSPPIITRYVREARPANVARRERDSRVVHTWVGFDRNASRGLIEGCPPGLAKKHNGCQPPGLAQQRDERRDDYYRPAWFGYPSVGDGRYYYDDGYLYRTGNAGSVLGYIPLLGGALSVGNRWPDYYDPAPVPDYYVNYYNLGSEDSYRYADDVLYRVDPQNDAITSIAALLTGDQFNVGQPMPEGYDVYNVPYEYRDQYYDTPEADYRYADGYVYEVDPTTQLIQAAIQLLT